MHITSLYNDSDPYPPKNGEIALWPNTRVVKCKTQYCVAQKRNEAIEKSDSPLIDHLVMRVFVSGSPSTSVTVYTKHVHVMFNQQTVSSLQTLGA